MRRNNRTIKVLISGQDFGGLGGAENFILNLASELNSKNVRTEFTSIKGSSFSEELSKETKRKVSFIDFRMDILGGLKGLIKFVLFLPTALVINFNILKEFKRSGGGFVLIPGFSDKIILSPLAKNLGLKIIWLEFPPIESLFKRNFGLPGLLYKLTSRLADKVVVCSENTKRSLLEKVKISKSKIKKIYCGIKLLSDNEIKRIEEQKQNKKEELSVIGETVIGMVSRIDEREKGQDTLIRALRILKRDYSKIKVVLVGGGNDEYIKGVIKKNNLGKDILLLGYRKDLYEIMSTFDIFVFPTRWKLEGFGLVPLEAMMLGVPTVVSKFGPVPEVVGNSALLSGIDEISLARDIKRVLENDKLKKRFIKRGKKRVNLFSIEKIADEYIKVFK